MIIKSVCNFKESLDEISDVHDSITSSPQPVKKIGYIRGDHDGYRWYTSYFPCHENLKTKDIKEEFSSVFEEIIQDKQFENVRAIATYCSEHKEAKNGFDDRYTFYIDENLCNYILVFTPRNKDYNIYLHAYIK